jgi:hypothetical protein
MKQKNAQGHVEMIISFVMFAGAIIFIFMVINPISKNKETSSIGDKIQRTLIENISTNIGKVYAIANESGGCYNVSYFISLYGNNFREIQDKDNPAIYTVYFSPIFEKYAPNNQDTCQHDSLTAYANERVIIYEFIKDLKLNYNNDYNSLRKQLKLTDNFLFSVYNIEGMKIEELSVDRNIPSGINVESYELPIRVINQSADIKPYILKINAWE